MIRFPGEPVSFRVRRGNAAYRGPLTMAHCLKRLFLFFHTLIPKAGRKDTAMLTPSLLSPVMEELYPLHQRLHRCPELSHQERNTTALIRETLCRWGIPVMDFGLETGVVARIRGAKTGPLLCLREDIDALPIAEMTGLPYASEVPGVSHACGHDLHTVSLLGCAKLLQEARQQLQGDVLLLFQCAEESCDGADTMLRSGIFRDAVPDAVVGFHCAPSVDLGKVAIVDGPYNASCDSITLTVTGKGGHGAHPEDCADPIVMAAGLLLQLQTLISRRNRATDPVVLSFGEIHGGSAPNIIPEEVVLRGTMRTFDAAVQQRHLHTLRTLCPAFCQSLGGCCRVETEKSLPPLINDPDICRRLRQCAWDVLGPDAVDTIIGPSMGSDDFSSVLHACADRGAQFLVGTGTDDPRTRIGLHAAENVFPPEAMETAVTMLTAFALDYLK